MKTVTLALAKQLQEWRFPQTTEFIYLEWAHRSGIRSQLIPRSTPTKIGMEFAAPVLEEILELLPDVNHHGTSYFLELGHGLDAKWLLTYRDVNDGQLNAWEGNDLVDLSAQCWLFLKEHNYID